MPDERRKTEAKPLKVLMIAPALPIIGGQTVQAARLLEKFYEEPGVQVDLQPINPQFAPGLQKIKYLRTILTSGKYISDLFVKIPRYDVIHIFSASYYSFLLAPTPAVLIARFFGKKTILNYRSGEAADHLQTWKRTAIPTIRLFDAVVAPSGYLVDVFAGFGLKSQTIFNFVNTERYRFRERKPLRPVFLSNRNFESHYNVACTLRAFALIRKDVPEAQLVVAGDGPEKDKLHRLAEELKLRNIEFLGAVAPEKMPEVYARADIYLNSPSIDNMPNSIIEAFSCGLPVVSTNAGGIPYIVENEKTGLLVDVNDCEALARAALKILESGETAQEIIREARRECVKYTWENVRGEWLKIYRDLAAVKSGAQTAQIEK
ncbi:MAG: glycosyltransferase family 4 protein [Acidobacteria bacterium]|nr:glycosyltransferase family 4 protein [Acidobacteriota bacterium]